MTTIRDPRDPTDTTVIKVVDGKIIRQRAPRPHERSISAKHDCTGHGILPSLPPERRQGDARPWMSVPAARPPPPEDASPPAARAEQPSALPSSLPPSPRKVLLVHRPAYTHLGTPNDEPELFEAGPERVVYRAYSRPSNRTEAIQLAAEVEARLVAAGTDARSASQCWQGALRELVRQVYVHCAERGELLDRVRAWYEGELGRLRAVERKGREKEKKLREALRQAGPRGGADGEDDSMYAAATQRLEFVSRVESMIASSGATQIGQLLAQSTAELPIEEKHEILSALLPQASAILAQFWRNSGAIILRSCRRSSRR